MLQGRLDGGGVRAEPSGPDAGVIKPLGFEVGINQACVPFELPRSCHGCRRGKGQDRGPGHFPIGSVQGRFHGGNPVRKHPQERGHEFLCRGPGAQLIGEDLNPRRIQNRFPVPRRPEVEGPVVLNCMGPAHGRPPAPVSTKAAAASAAAASLGRAQMLLSSTTTSAAGAP
jgi:hypothetical protein